MTVPKIPETVAGAHGVVDAHCHIGVSVDGAGLTEDNFNEIFKLYPAEKIVVFPIDEKDKGTTFERLNERLAAFARRDARVVPFGRVNPSAGAAALAEMDRFPALGMRGLKLHPYSEGFGPDDAEAVFLKAASMRLPIMLHSTHRLFFEEAAGWERLFNLVDTPIIVAHCGKDSYRRFAEAARKFPHVYADTTCVSLNRARIVFDILGPDRIVYGSDLPYSHPAVEFAKFNLFLTEEEKRKVYRENALRALGLSGG